MHATLIKPLVPVGVGNPVKLVGTSPLTTDQPVASEEQHGKATNIVLGIDHWNFLPLMRNPSQECMLNKHLLHYWIKYMSKFHSVPSHVVMFTLLFAKRLRHRQRLLKE